MADKPAERRGLIPSDFYRRILAVMPIVCVDLMVIDVDGRLLLLQRRREPAKGHWWFPGGRVHLGETRAESASRKLNGVPQFPEPDLVGTGGREIFVHVVPVLPPAARIRQAEFEPELRIDLVSEKYSSLDQVRAEDGGFTCRFCREWLRRRSRPAKGGWSRRPTMRLRFAAALCEITACGRINGIGTTSSDTT